jgi:hypothetical protein
MIAFLQKLFAKKPAQARAAAPVEYNGMMIIATPRAVAGGWSTEGLIREKVSSDAREVAFIRADTCMSEQEAVVAAQGKARKIIDERGAKVFIGQRA